jgi:acyl carrier protein
MSTTQQIFESLKDVLLNKFNVPDNLIQPQTTFADLGLDSLTLMEFIFEAEDTFRVRIPEDKLNADLSQITLASVCQAIETIQSSSLASPT